jgi:hypothetical protein
MPDTRLNPRDVTEKYAIKICVGACTKWNYNAIGGDNFYTDLTNKPSP